MTQIAKVFMTGRSQAVRLPAEFRFDCKEVYIHKDPLNGDIILSRSQRSWENFFNIVDHLKIPKDFMNDRQDLIIQERELF